MTRGQMGWVIMSINIFCYFILSSCVLDWFWCVILTGTSKWSPKSWCFHWNVCFAYFAFEFWLFNQENCCDAHVSWDVLKWILQCHLYLQLNFQSPKPIWSICWSIYLPVMVIVMTPTFLLSFSHYLVWVSMMDLLTELSFRTLCWYDLLIPLLPALTWCHWCIALSQEFMNGVIPFLPPPPS